MANKEQLLAYKHAEVAKIFPLYGSQPFKGTVKAVDTSGKDNTPFRIVYEDGDSEWITLQELESILVKDSSKQEAPKSDKKRARSSKQATEEPQATTDGAAAAAAADQQQEHKKHKKQKQGKTSSQQQQQQQQQQRADASAAAADAARQALKAAKASAKKAPAAAAAADKQEQQQQGVPGVTSFTITAGAARAAADKAAAGTSKDAAAAAAAGKGEQPSKPSKTAATPAAAAAPVAAPAGTPGRKGKAAAGGGASMSTADTQGMLAAIHQAAAPTADKLSHDRQVARMPYQGPGAAVLPAMSQVVVTGGHCYVTLHSAPRPRHSTTPGKVLSQQPSTSAAHAAAIDYEVESAALLGELQRLLQHANTDKRWLIKVRVTLRSMQEGLPGFQAAWNAWAARDELPVMTLVEGAGPFKAAGVMLEATALAAP